MKKKKYRIYTGILLLFLLLLIPAAVQAAEIDTALDDGTDTEADSDVGFYLEKIIGELKLEEVDAFSENQLMGRISFSDMVTQLVEQGGSGLDAATVCTWVFDLFFYELAAAKPLFIQMVLFAVLFAVINRFFIHDVSYVTEISFFMIYGAMMILLLQSFLLISDVVEEGIEQICQFLTALVPTYAATLMLSGNLSSAGVFYEMVFGIICVLEWAMKVFLVPGIHIFVLLILLDHLFEEEKISKLAELIESGIRLCLKLAVSSVLGLGVVQSLLAPARDRISQSIVLKSMTALPGVGNGINFAEEILLGCGMLVKNSVGIAGLCILLILGMTPVIKVFSFTFLYRILAAVLQPVADKRIVECIQGVAKGSALYLKIMVDTMLLFLITISMVTASTSFVY